MPRGLLSSALVAAMPSPLYPAVPVPAIVVMIPEVLTLRIVLLEISDT